MFNMLGIQRAAKLPLLCRQHLVPIKLVVPVCPRCNQKSATYRKLCTYGYK